MSQRYDSLASVSEVDTKSEIHGAIRAGWTLAPEGCASKPRRVSIAASGTNDAPVKPAAASVKTDGRVEPAAAGADVVDDPCKADGFACLPAGPGQPFHNDIKSF